MSKQNYNNPAIVSLLFPRTTNRNELINCVLKSPNDIDRRYILTEGMDKLVTGQLYNVTKTQMRTLYEVVQKADPDNYSKLHVKLVYIAGKFDKKELKEFVVLLIDILKQDIDKNNNINNLKDFMEAALAFHKFYASK